MKCFVYVNDELIIDTQMHSFFGPLTKHSIVGITINENERRLHRVAKYNRNRKKRRWFLNVGDPIENTKKGIQNPNDLPRGKN